MARSLLSAVAAVLASYAALARAGAGAGAVLATVPVPRRDLARAALSAREDFRWKAFEKAGGRYPRETHFDELDFRTGFTELWAYAVRNARWALGPTQGEVDLREAEAQLLKSASRSEKRQRKAWREARLTLDALEPRLLDALSAKEHVQVPVASSVQLRGAAVAPVVNLSNGVRIPAWGLGTTMLNGAVGEAAIEHALRSGYRLVDTAQAYGNEAEVGRAWARAGVPRSEVFIATKLSEDRDCARGRARRLVQKQLKLLGSGYIDQYMLHGPCPGMYAAWSDLEELYDAGVLRSLGVSNFDERDLAAFVRRVRVRPHIVQNKFSVYHYGRAPHQGGDFLRTVHEHAAVLMGYCNLDAYPHVLQPLLDRHVESIAASLNRTPAQVLLRHALQHGTVVIPKSERFARLEENAALFDFELSEDDMRRLDALKEFAQLLHPMDGSVAPPTTDEL